MRALILAAVLVLVSVERAVEVKAQYPLCSWETYVSLLDLTTPGGVVTAAPTYVHAYVFAGVTTDFNLALAFGRGIVANGLESSQVRPDGVRLRVFYPPNRIQRVVQVENCL